MSDVFEAGNSEFRSTWAHCTAVKWQSNPNGFCDHVPLPSNETLQAVKPELMQR